MVEAKDMLYRQSQRKLERMRKSFISFRDAFGKQRQGVY